MYSPSLYLEVYLWEHGILAVRKVSLAHSAGGFDAVLGARGSQLQLVLNALFHIENSPGNLSWDQYGVVRDHPGVSEAYPFALGDNFILDTELYLDTS